MKILVNHLVHNEILCRINPQKQNDCDPMESILLQIQRMYEMQDYIDAQHGGPGEGWFQIVTAPAKPVKLLVMASWRWYWALKCPRCLSAANSWMWPNVPGKTSWSGWTSCTNWVCATFSRFTSSITPLPATCPI